MKKFWDVYAFQMMETIRKKGFLISTAIMVALIFVVSFSNHVNQGNKEKGNIFVLTNSEHYAVNEPSFKSQFGKDYNMIDLKETEKAVKQSVKDGEREAVYVINEKNGLPSIHVYYKSEPARTVSIWLENHLKEQYIQKTAGELKLNEQEIAALFAPVTSEYVEMADLQRSYGLVYPLVFIMYLFIMGFGQSIAIHVVSEKSSKVMEILLPKVHPITSLYAKIFAALSTGLLQFGIMVGSFAATRMMGWSSGDRLNVVGMSVSLSDIRLDTIAWFLFFFVTGFLFYGLLYASVGSMVAKVEDLSPVLTPIVFLLMGSFGFGIYTIFKPESWIAELSAYIPPFTPIVLFARILMEEATTFEIIGALSVFGTAFVILTYFAQKWFKQGVASSGRIKKSKKEHATG